MKALLIGINFYDTSSELAGCVNDINNVETALKQLNFETNNIVKIYDTRMRNSNHEPTSRSIIDGIQWLRDLPAGGTGYMHYSSHGFQMRDDNGDEADGMDEVICTVDGFITDDVLNKLLVEDWPEDAKLRAVIDTCHSGSMLDLPCRWQRGNKFFMENNSGRTNKNVLMISGCQDDQTSADAWIREDKQTQGAMTWSFLDSLEWAKTHDPSITWKELAEKMRFKLLDGCYTQTPQLSMCSRLQLRSKVFEDLS